MGLERIAETILFVEDDEATRAALCQPLRRRVGTILEAANGAQGLEIFKSERPAIVITDINMPVMDGLRMSREIKAIDGKTQIIVATAHNDSKFLLEAIEIGVDQFVIKPVELSKLFGAVEKAWAVASREMELKRHNEEREKLIVELNEALAKVKLLSGFLPICSSCKKIRDDRGYWNSIEKYIIEHSEATFTHGICPDCMKALYPEFVK